MPTQLGYPTPAFYKNCMKFSKIESHLNNLQFLLYGYYEFIISISLDYVINQFITLIKK